MRHHGMRRALNGWAEALRSARALISLATKAIQRLRYYPVARSFGAWERHRRRRNASQRNDRFLTAVARRLLHTNAARWGFDTWRRTQRGRLSFAQAQRRLIVTHMGALRSAVFTWARRAYQWKADGALSQLAGAQEELAQAHQRIRESESDDRRSITTLEMESAALRKSLSEARGLNKTLEERAAHFDQQYRRLWKATHDPAYVTAMRSDPSQSGSSRSDSWQQHESKRGSGGTRSSFGSNVSVESTTVVQPSLIGSRSPSLRSVGLLGQSPNAASEIMRRAELWQATLKTPSRSPAFRPSTTRASS
jgi:hypothetical protein